MRSKTTRRTNRVAPAQVVRDAYAAANRGRYSKANEFLAPEVRKKLLQAHALATATGRRLRRALVQLKEKPGEAGVRGRKTLRALIRSHKNLVGMRLGSARVLAGLWKASTRRRSIVKLEVTRQVVRGSRARVFMRLTLRDGTELNDSEPLVLHRGRWLLG